MFLLYCPALTILFAFLNFCGQNITFKLFPSRINFFQYVSTNVTVDSKLMVPAMTDIEYYVYFTGASYCSKDTIESWTCDYCKKTQVNPRDIQVLTNATFNTLAILALDKINRKIIVTFRGTINMKNSLEDAAQKLVCPHKNNCSDIKVHQGFLLATLSLYSHVVSALKDFKLTLGTEFSCVLVGHSLGGAMALITLYLLQSENLSQSCTYSLFTYGQPRAGNKAFVDYIDRLSIVSARVVFNLDIVPHIVPARCGYLHHQNEVFNYHKNLTVCSKLVYEDPSCSNYYYPCYSVKDHLTYFDVDYSSCPSEDPSYFLTQMLL